MTMTAALRLVSLRVFSACMEALKLLHSAECFGAGRKHKKSMKDALQYSSRLSETSLYTNTDLGCISHVHPSHAI